ncbi:hypothetical protein GGI35DRAFT_54512 [Trichoderma velutinum]
MNRLVAATLLFIPHFLSPLCACVCPCITSKPWGFLKTGQCIDTLKRRAVAAVPSLPQAFLDREAADLEDGYQGTLHAFGPSIGRHSPFRRCKFLVYMEYFMCAVRTRIRSEGILTWMTQDENFASRPPIPSTGISRRQSRATGGEKEEKGAKFHDCVHVKIPVPRQRAVMIRRHTRSSPSGVSMLEGSNAF